jgi:hypothetical protein
MQSYLTVSYNEIKAYVHTISRKNNITTTHRHAFWIVSYTNSFIEIQINLLIKGNKTNCFHLVERVEVEIILFLVLQNKNV